MDTLTHSPAHDPAPLAPVVPLDTPPMDAFLERPLVMWGRSAHDVLLAVAQGHFEDTRDPRERLEDMIERVGDLWQRLIARLDALDADPDLEPYLSAWEAMDQRRRYEGADDHRECGDDDDPRSGRANGSVSSIGVPAATTTRNGSTTAASPNRVKAATGRTRATRPSFTRSPERRCDRAQPPAGVA